MKSVLKRKW